MLVGFAFGGISAAFLFIPVMPEMVEVTQEKFESTTLKINDICSGIFNIAFGVGSFLGP